MSIPGVNMEDPEQPQQDDPALAAADDPEQPAADEPEDDDTLLPTVTVGQQQMVPVAELIKHRKEARGLKRQLAELQPRVANAERVSGQLAQVQPLIEQLQRMTPEQREAVMTGKLPSPEGTRHDAQDDEARELAEDLGLIAADGSLDIARARKRLDKDNVRVQRMLEQATAPMRLNTAQTQASAIRQQAKTLVLKDGTPMATAESIDEAYDMLPPELASQKNVAMVAIGTAMLIDKMKGRTPRAAGHSDPRYADPIVSENVGRRSTAPALTAEERATATKLGLTEKQLQSAATALSTSNGRRGINLEG